MQASIMLLPGNKVGERLCNVAEEVLTDVSVAFGHTFTILREKIGESSMKAYGTELTEEAVTACECSDATIIGDTDLEGVDTLLLSLGISCRIRAFFLRSDEQNKLYMVKTSALDTKTLASAIQTAFEFSCEEELPLCFVAPSGKSALDFRAAIRLREKEFPDVHVTELSPSQAVEKIIRDPEGLGVMVVPPYAGSMLCTMATVLHNAPMLLYDACIGKTQAVFAPVVVMGTQDNDRLNPLGMILAVAQLLRDALHLPREADCVDAAVHNVLAAGWRTPDMSDGQAIDTNQMLRLVCDQIELAGEFLRPNS